MTALYGSILFVAPDDKTLQAVIPELDALYELGYQVRTLQGEVTDDRLFDAVRRAKYDILHFASHGDKAGSLFTDGSRLTFGGLQQVVRQCGARFVFLNECNSSSLAQRLVNGGLPAAVGTFDEVGDSIAKQGSMAFYQELARTQDVAQAYHFAFSGEHFGFYHNGNYAALMTEPIQSLRHSVRTLSYTVSALCVATVGTLAMLVLHVIR